MSNSYKVTVIAGTKVVADMAQKVSQSVIEASLELPPIAGGATEATAVLLPPPNPLPVNSNRKMTKVVGWYKNSTGAAWEAPKDYDNTNWWSYETELWSLGSSLPMPKIPVANNVVKGGTNATSQDAVFTFVEPINDKVGYLLPVVTTNVTNPLQIGLFKSSGDLDDGWTNWKAVVSRQTNGASSFHYKGNPPVASSGFDAVLGKKEDNSWVVLIPGGNGTLLDTTQQIADEIVELSANFRAEAGYSQLFELIKHSDTIPSNKVDGLNEIVEKINDVISKDYSLIEDITSPLTVGVMGIDGIVNPSFSNWRNNGQKTTNGAKFVHYKGTTPLYASSSQIPYLLGWKEGESLPDVIAKSSVIVYKDEIIAVDPMYTKVTANFRALAGDSQKLEIVEEQNVISASNIKGVTKIKVAGKKNYCGTSKTFMDGKVRNGSLVRGYQTWIRESVEFSLGERNYGLSGHSWAGNPENSNTIVDKMSTWEAADIWSAEGPTNDYKLNVQVGTSNDYLNNTGRNTLYGALRLYIDKVYALSPAALVVFFIDCQRNNDTWTDNSVNPPVVHKYDGFTPNKAGFTLENYNDAFRWVAKRIGAIIVDAHNESRINQYNLSHYTVDGLHENDEGYRIEAELYLNRVYR